MAELVHPKITVQPQLRLLDVHRDLLHIADIIELCFASSMDPDGREYLRQMREFGQQELTSNWTSRPMIGPMTMTGYVWEEGGRLVGNLTLIPTYKQTKRVYLIANVAVLPDYRRRGIGRSLTQAAIDHAIRRGASSAWLQVRSDNESAYQLYQSLGFVERFRRTTWQGDHPLPDQNHHTGVSIGPRKTQDWPKQEAWLKNTYPSGVTWNLPFHLNQIRPSLLNNLYSFFTNEPIRQWSARLNSRLIGVVTWDGSRSFADNLWLAASPEDEDEAVFALLPEVRRRVPLRRPLAVNYPASQAEEAFREAGFYHQQTLVWMEKDLEMQLSGGGQRIS